MILPVTGCSFLSQSVHRDFLPILANPTVFHDLIDVLVSKVKRHPQVDVIVGLDARGFLLGPTIAHQLGLKFVPVRKAGIILLSVSYSTSTDLFSQGNCRAE